MDIIRLESASSTNTWVSLNEKDLPTKAFVYSVSQTAGRGQRGNSWESEPGKNITASVLFHPLDFPAINQFFLSEAFSMAIIDFLSGYGVKAKVKWPNDIYVGDKKICGILVEHVVTGKNISRTIAGFGININQTVFLSDAPNPVSLSLITGEKYDLEELIQDLATIIENYLSELGKVSLIHQKFMKMMWRNDHNFYKFVDRKQNEGLEARIHDVAPTGILTIETRNGELREYAFKEVEFVI